MASFDDLLLRRLAQFLRHPQFIHALANGQMDEVLERINHLEWVIEQAFQQYPNLKTRTHRPALLSRLLFTDIRKLNGDQLQKRIENIQNILDGILVYHHGLRKGPVEVNAEKGKYLYRADPDLDKEFWGNVSIGLSGDYRKVKSQMNNNDIVSNAQLNPQEFLGDIEDRLSALGVPAPDRRLVVINQESASRIVRKIDDVRLEFEVSDLTFDTAGGRVTLPGRFFRKTTDGKFYRHTSGIGSYKNVYQQVIHTFQDRVMDDYGPLLSDLLAAGMPAAEEARVAAAFFPIVFQHLVIRPADTAAPTAQLLARYDEQFVRHAKPYLSAGLAEQLGARYTDHPVLEAELFKAIENHGRDWFDSGAFMDVRSRLHYEDLP